MSKNHGDRTNKGKTKWYIFYIIALTFLPFLTYPSFLAFLTLAFSPSLPFLTLPHHYFLSFHSPLYPSSFSIIRWMPTWKLSMWIVKKYVDSQTYIFMRPCIILINVQRERKSYFPLSVWIFLDLRQFWEKKKGAKFFTYARVTVKEEEMVPCR